MKQYKLIIAPTPHDLEARVQKFCKDSEETGEEYGFIGAPQVLGHEAYAQAIYYFTYEVITT